MKAKLLALPLVCLSLLGCSNNKTNTELLNEKYRNKGYDVVVTNAFYVPDFEYQSTHYSVDVKVSDDDFNKNKDNYDARTNYDLKICCGDGTKEIKVNNLYIYRDSTKTEYQLDNDTVETYNKNYKATLDTRIENDTYSLYMVFDKSVIVFFLTNDEKDKKSIDYYFNDQYVFSDYAYLGENLPSNSYITLDCVYYVDETKWRTNDGKVPETRIQDTVSLYATDSDKRLCAEPVKKDDHYELQINKMFEDTVIIVPKIELDSYLKISLKFDTFIKLYLPVLETNIILDLDLGENYNILYEGTEEQFQEKVSFVDENKTFDVIYNKVWEKM